MKIEWVLLCEGIGQDAKGALTAIGLNQNVVIGTTLPAITKRGLIVHIGGVDLVTESEVVFHIDVIAPGGDTLLTQGGKIKIGEKVFPDLPTAFDIPTEFLLQLPSYGTYQVQATVGFPDGTELKESTELYLMKPT
jgi:hypothetical protein